MAENRSSENNTEARLCANNCGFYGTAEMCNLCSKCYTDLLKLQSMNSISMDSGDVSRQSQADEISSGFSQIHRSESKFATEPTSTSASECSATSESVGGSNAAKSRCERCKRKVGLLGFKCRCGGLYCDSHRHPKEHLCLFDFKAMERERLEDELVQCRSDKLQYRI